MIVTDKQYHMEERLIKKIDLMIKRCTQPKPERDAVLLVEGGEGEGKTTMSGAIAYYVAFKTGRVFDNSRVFFSAEKIVEFAKTTKEQIIVYDEPALDMLSSDYWKKEQKNLIKLLMVARKNRHFIIFNITKFYKFPEYIIVDRALGMIHVYSRNDVEAGRFVYIKRKAIEYLYNNYRSSKRRDYKKYSCIRGTFPDVLDLVIDVDKYNKEKDDAILSVGVAEKEDKWKIKYDRLEKRLLEVAKTDREIAEMMEVHYNTVYNHKKKLEISTFEADVPILSQNKVTNIINKGCNPDQPVPVAVGPILYKQNGPRETDTLS